MSESSEMPCRRIVRRFDVPPERLFDALTKPDATRVWWGEDTAFEIDLRVGGRWTITRGADGTEYVATGQCLAVDRPTRSGAARQRQTDTGRRATGGNRRSRGRQRDNPSKHLLQCDLKTIAACASGRTSAANTNNQKFKMMWFFGFETECVDCHRRIPERVAKLNDGRCDACARSHAAYVNERLSFQRRIENGEAFRHTADSPVVPTEFQLSDCSWVLQPGFYGEYKGGTIKTMHDGIADAEASTHGNLFLVSRLNGQLNFGFTSKFGVCEYINEDSGHWLYALTEENLTGQVEKEHHVVQNCPCCGVGMLWYPSRFHIPRTTALQIARQIAAGEIPANVKWLESGDFSLTEQGYG